MTRTNAYGFASPKAIKVGIYFCQVFNRMGLLYLLSVILE